MITGNSTLIQLQAATVCSQQVLCSQAVHMQVCGAYLTQELQTSCVPQKWSSPFARAMQSAIRHRPTQYNHCMWALQPQSPTSALGMTAQAW